jgi:hypothetical protein
MKKIIRWFNKKFGWFFTNGKKYKDNPNMYN